MATHSDPLTIGQIEAANVYRLTSLRCCADSFRRTQWEVMLCRTWGHGDRDEWTHGQCKGCCSPVDATPLQANIGKSDSPDGAGAPAVALTFRATVCETCMVLARDHYNQDEPAVREVSQTPKWDEKCPPRFREAIQGQLPPAVDAPAYRRVIAWRPSERKGIAMKGPSGSGKSTALWALARELEREGSAPVVLTAVELGRVLSKAARDIEEVGWLCKCRVLMIDDMGKEKATPAMAALLWEVLDKRYSAGLPLILSTRFDGADLRSRFGEECLGDDIVRRLNELCAGLTFKLREEQARAA